MWNDAIKRKRRSGFTLIEVVISTGIMAMVMGCTAAMMIATMKCYDSASARTFTDCDAATAMQMIVTDIREANEVKFIANGNRLRIIPPEITEEGYYNRYKPDPAHQYDYYLSDSTGVPGHDGTWLWRGKDNDRKPVKRNVVALEFKSDCVTASGKIISVKITVVTETNTPTGKKRTELTERVVYLRNS